MKWSEKVKKWKKSESIFGPLFLFNFRYIKVEVWGNNIDIKKCTTIFSWEWSSKQVGGVDKKFFKNTLYERVFEKMVSNLSILKGIFEAKFQSWFFFEKNLQGFFCRIFFSKDFLCFFEKKFKGIFLQRIFVKRFPCKFTPWLVLHVLHFIGNFFYKTRPSLARAAFIRNSLNNQQGKLLEKEVS